MVVLEVNPAKDDFRPFNMGLPIGKSFRVCRVIDGVVNE